MSRRERSLARCSHADIGEVYNDMVGLVATFDYDDGSSQGLGGYGIEAAFIVRFMAAMGVSQLRKAVGVPCWVTHDHGKIYRIEPLFEKDGRPFDIEEWSAWVKERLPGISYSELLTGKRPPSVQ